MKIEDELYALKQNLLSVNEIRYVSAAQVKALASLITQGLEHKNRDMRIAVLRVWANDAMKQIVGIEINSGKNITSPIASFLISLLKDPEPDMWTLSPYGQTLIRETEKYVIGATR